VHAATRSLIEQAIVILLDELKTISVKNSPAVWDRFKGSIVEQMKRLKREARKRMTRGFRQRIKRIKLQLEKCTRDNTDGPGSRRYVLESLHQVQEARRQLKRRAVIGQNAWSSKASTKAFFRRVCTKFGDSVIPTLVSTNEAIKWQLHDKANILKDSWAETFNGQADAKCDIKPLLGNTVRDGRRRTWQLSMRT
jgi:hypothetical protein